VPFDLLRSIVSSQVAGLLRDASQWHDAGISRRSGPTIRQPGTHGKSTLADDHHCDNEQHERPSGIRFESNEYGRAYDEGVLVHCVRERTCP